MHTCAHTGTHTAAGTHIDVRSCRAHTRTHLVDAVRRAGAAHKQHGGHQPHKGAGGHRGGRAAAREKVQDLGRLGDVGHQQRVRQAQVDEGDACSSVAQQREAAEARYMKHIPHASCACQCPALQHSTTQRRAAVHLRAPGPCITTPRRRTFARLAQRVLGHLAQRDNAVTAAAAAAPLALTAAAAAGGAAPAARALSAATAASGSWVQDGPDVQVDLSNQQRLHCEQPPEAHQQGGGGAKPPGRSDGGQRKHACDSGQGGEDGA